MGRKRRRTGRVVLGKTWWDGLVAGGLDAVYEREGKGTANYADLSIHVCVGELQACLAVTNTC